MWETIIIEHGLHLFFFHILLSYSPHCIALMLALMVIYKCNWEWFDWNFNQFFFSWEICQRLGFLRSILNNRKYLIGRGIQIFKFLELCWRAGSVLAGELEAGAGSLKYLCICVFVYMCICVFVYCVFVLPDTSGFKYLCICSDKYLCTCVFMYLCIVYLC